MVDPVTWAYYAFRTAWLYAKLLIPKQLMLLLCLFASTQTEMPFDGPGAIRKTNQRAGSNVDGIRMYGPIQVIHP